MFTLLGRSAFAAATVAIVSLAARTADTQSARQSQSTFRTGVDITLLDVTVLDGKRQPVKGLVAEDFTVLVDGQPRPIVSFEAVDLAPAAMPTAPWMHAVTRDVVTNTEPSSRLVVILIDDGSQAETGDLWSVQKTREIAKAVVDRLGPADMASVLFTNSTRSAQAFTRDRVRLKTAIDKAAMFPASGGQGPIDTPLYERGDCYCGLCSIDAIGAVAEALRDAPGQRKVIMYVSVGLFVLSPAQADSALELNCQLRKQDSLDRSFRSAQMANVMIQTIDPKGLVVGGPLPPDRLSNQALRIESLRTIAETTGGRAVVNNNDMEREVPALLDETSSFYVLGVDAGSPTRNASSRPVQIRVNRPDVDVRTRKGLYVMTSRERRDLEADVATGGLSAALKSPFPRGDIPLDVAVAPFAGPGPGRTPIVAVALNVHPDPADAGGSSERFTAVAAGFVAQTGGSIGKAQQIVNVTWPRPRSDDTGFELLPRLPMAPGRYELRLAVESDTGRTGSVHTYVDVPNFKAEALSVSGLVLLRDTSSMVAPGDAFADILARPPTSRRAFDQTSRVTAFLRVYQIDAGQPSPATVRLSLTDSRGAERLAHDARIDRTEFESSRSADFSFDLPIASLDPGEYLLTVDVTANRKSVQRTLRFQRR